MRIVYHYTAFGTVGGGAIEFYAREKCKEVIKNRTSFSEKYCLLLIRKKVMIISSPYQIESSMLIWVSIFLKSMDTTLLVEYIGISN